MGGEVIEPAVDGAVDELFFVGVEREPVLGRRFRTNRPNGHAPVFSRALSSACFAVHERQAQTKAQ
jgi:hypothetical protein